MHPLSALMNVNILLIFFFLNQILLLLYICLLLLEHVKQALNTIDFISKYSICISN